MLDSPEGEIAPMVATNNPESTITLLQTHYPHFLRTSGLAGERIVVRFEPWLATEELFDLAVVHLPKSRDLLDLVLDLVSTVTSGRILLVGPLKGGITAAGKQLAKLFGNAVKLDAARHCALYETETDESRTSSLERWMIKHRVRAADTELEVVSCPGVFSHGRLDEGTALLLETLSVSGRKLAVLEQHGALDFGCGCGVIGAFVHLRWPDARIDMVDANAYAVAAARETAQLHELPADRVYPSDVFSHVNGRYGLIISNPPFHQGFDTEYGTVERFISGACSRLVPGGALRIVANHFLPYRPLIEARFGHCRTVAENSQYRVYEATAKDSRRRN